MAEQDRTLIIKFDNTTPERLDKYLAEQLSDLSRSRIQDLIRGGYIQVDGETIDKVSTLLPSPCSISITIPPAEPSHIIPEAIPLDILYEDENVIAVNKPAGLVVHPSNGHQSGTLVHALLAHAPFLQGIGGVQRPGIVHRLDRDTSGVLLVAKNEKTHRYLQEQFKSRAVNKIYVALVDGHPPKIGRAHV